MADVTKLDLLTLDPIDKIVAKGTVTVVNDGATSNAPQSSKIVESSITNPYGKKVFCRFKWSIDGTNYSNPEAHLVYTYTDTLSGHVTTFGGLKAAVCVGVSDSSIIFRTANGYHGNVADDGTNYTYTTNSLTFTITYALYEVS